MKYYFKKIIEEQGPILLFSIFIFLLLYCSIDQYNNLNLNQVMNFSVGFLTISVLMYRVFFCAMEVQILSNEIRMKNLDEFEYIQLANKVRKNKVKCMGYSYLWSFLIVVLILKWVSYKSDLMKNFMIIVFISVVAISYEIFNEHISKHKFNEYRNKTFIQ